MSIQLPNNQWSNILEPVLKQKETKQLFHDVELEYDTHHILPDKNDIFKALQLTDYGQTKVVILGQDPYPNPNNAMGLSFSVKPGGKVPMSLKNIYKERLSDLSIPISTNGDLSSWAKQGVLLLNTTLTVVAGKSNSHQKIGWQPFTTAIIQALNQKHTPVVFILWGNYAKSYQNMISSHHFIIESSHPSGFSARKGFFGSQPFSKANDYLIQSHQTPIDWSN